MDFPGGLSGTLQINQSKNDSDIHYHLVWGQKDTIILSLQLIKINDSWTPNQHIRMNERSCDTEDRSNDAENSGLPSQK